jgi:hypothetical protein
MVVPRDKVSFGLVIAARMEPPAHLWAARRPFRPRLM